MVLMLWRFQDMHMFADRHARSISRGTHGISVAGAARGDACFLAVSGVEVSRSLHPLVGLPQLPADRPVASAS